MEYNLMQAYGFDSEEDHEAYEKWAADQHQEDEDEYREWMSLQDEIDLAYQMEEDCK